jgi:hypothetical protein
VAISISAGMGANPSVRKIKPVKACLQEADFDLTVEDSKNPPPKYILSSCQKSLNQRHQRNQRLMIFCFEIW